MVSLSDESAITWFFLFGQVRFQRSVHGAMVDRLIRDSMGSARCCVCHGAGIIGDEEGVARHRGVGKPTEKRKAWRITEESPTGTQPERGRGIATDEQRDEYHQVSVGSCCQFCNGTGWVAKRRASVDKCDACSGQPSSARLACPECLGTSRRMYTARPTHAEHQESGVEVDGDTLKRFAVVSRRLERMCAADRLTLERYYGAHGFSWANQPGGRIVGLLEFTRAGRALLRRTRVKGDEQTGASRAERIAVQLDAQTRAPEPWRGALIDEAREQAESALRIAHSQWDTAFGTLPWPEQWELLQDDITATGEALEAWYERNGCDAADDAEQWPREAVV
jgi:hypothetical protein